MAHDIMFSSWLSKGDVKAKQSVLEALGQMAVPACEFQRTEVEHLGAEEQHWGWHWQ